MKKTIVSLMYFLLFLITGASLASTIIVNSENNYWRCMAYDAEDKQWTANSQYERAATIKALDACKKQSRVPLSCKISKDYCDAMINGRSTRPMWRCIALDQMAKHWISNFYTQRDEAALAAKAFCKQHSAMPDSCYINLMTCKNINEQT